MFDFMFKLFGWTSGQINTFNNMLDRVKLLFSGEIPFRRIGAALLAIVELFFSAAFKTPVTPSGEALDLTGYKCVFEDYFDGDTLDLDAWHHRGPGPRRGGFNAASQAQVKDGKLVLTGEYLKNGEYGEGWYTGMIALNKKYNKGYFEINCKINEGPGFWSAFWIQGDSPYDHVLSDGGRNSAEIDIFEAMNAEAKTAKMRNTVSSTIHCNGVDDDVENIDSCHIGTYYVDDIYNEYNTYGLKWTDDEYIFYINGIEAGRSSFGKGVSITPEEIIVSLEVPENMPESVADNHDYKTQYTIDYVKIYQLEN